MTMPPTSAATSGVHRRARESVRSLLTSLPDGWRASLARRVPRLPVSRPANRPESAYDVAHFERCYARPDPWGLTASENEAAKYALTLELAGEGPFDRALEIGCGEGLFTERLAPLCGVLLAVDISRRAVDRAHDRCARFPHVAFLAAPLPAGYPDGPFDLVVASDVLYYWRNEDLIGSARRIERSLAPGGRFVCVHYARPVNAVDSGDVVHDTLLATLKLVHMKGDALEIGQGRPYRIDVWQRPRVGSPAVAGAAAAPASAAG